VKILATPSQSQVELPPPSLTRPPWYGPHSIAGLGCLPWWEVVWLLDAFAHSPLRADRAAATE
jgi:hypothetical protein